MQLRQEACREYCGSYIYEDGMLSQILVDGGYVKPVYKAGKFPMRPNRKNFSSDAAYMEALKKWQERVKNSRRLTGFDYYFYLTDHLGNNREVVDATGEIVQENHYYPFGGLMGESIDGDAQRYKYNGKELDRMNGLDWMDYGARMYDGGRFTTVDPLAHKYYSISPYAYCANNPVKYIDPDGRKVVNSNGVIIFYINKSNKLCVSSHASENEKMVYQGMMLTPTGQKMLRQMIKSPILINMQFKDKCADDKKGKITYADTQQYKKGKDNGITRDKNGKFRTKYSTITFYMKTIEESLGWTFSQNNGLTLIEAVGAEAAHESVHASDEEEINKDISSANNGKFRSKQETEKKPREIEQQFRDELRNINDENQ